MATKWTKDPDARLDYRWDWSAWLQADETIVDSELIYNETEVVVESFAHDDKGITAWISGGEVGGAADITCRITTSDGRVDDRTATLRIKQM